MVQLLTEIQWAINRAAKLSWIDETTKKALLRSSYHLAAIKKQFEDTL
jgi:hypothetical protein